MVQTLKTTLIDHFSTKLVTTALFSAAAMGFSPFSADLWSSVNRVAGYRDLMRITFAKSRALEPLADRPGSKRPKAELYPPQAFGS